MDTLSSSISQLHIFAVARTSQHRHPILSFPLTLGYCLCVSTFYTSKQRTGIRIRAISRHTDVERDARTKIQPQRPYRDVAATHVQVDKSDGRSSLKRPMSAVGYSCLLFLLHGPSSRERKGIW
ncbi:hypothetical protein CPC08DRAFT_331861 [Agrocybe pediades]|nr:hypothetical protein CPC08DRAFT_331861 [Agrocybe pediades]